MSIVHFIRLILKNIFLVLICGFIVSALIFYSTRNEPHKYTSKAIIYTGFRTGYDIESNTGRSTGHYAIIAKFDNFITMIKSRTTIESVAFRLLAAHMVEDIKKPDTYRHLNEIFPLEKRKEITDTTSIDKTILNLKKYLVDNGAKELTDLFSSFNPFYGINTLSNVHVEQVSGSDLIEITYDCTHARICQQTLDVMCEIILMNYIEMDEKQATTVIKYFEKRVSETQERLNVAEKELQQFTEENKIINFEAQTSSIASQKEDIEKVLQDEKMLLASARATLKNLESKMSVKVSKSLQSEQYSNTLKSLTLISDKIENIKVFNSGNPTELHALEEKKAKLVKELEEAQKNIFEFDHTPEGIKIKEILTKWLDNIIVISEAQSRIKTLEERQKEFEKNYNRFAPIGSALKKKEREIAIIETEYLTNLNNLNASRLRQQNAEQASSIKVVTPAFYPMHPEPSKRKFLISLGFVVGVILSVVALIVIDFVDNSIKSTERVIALSGLPLLSQFPYFPNKKKSAFDFEYIKMRITELIVQKIFLVAKDKKSKPVVIALFSMQATEGKTFVAKEMSAHIAKNAKTLLIIPKSEEQIEIASDNIILKEYEPEKHSRENTIEDFIGEECNISDFEIVIIEMLPYTKKEIPVKIAEMTDVSILVCRSDRNWNVADTHILDIYKKMIDHEPFVFLNGVVVDTLEEQLGELPRKRSAIRKIMKKILTFQIGPKSKF